MISKITFSAGTDAVDSQYDLLETILDSEEQEGEEENMNFRAADGCDISYFLQTGNATLSF